MNNTFSITYQGDLRCQLTHLQSGTTIYTDAPLDNQGKGQAFSPTDLLCVSLASCMITIMGIKARDKNIDLKNTSLQIVKHMKADPRRIGGIDIVFQFPQNLLLNDNDKTILERCAHTCPVKYSIHPDIDVNIEFKWA